MESGCDAWIQDVSPFLTNQMIHLPIFLGGQDIITTGPHDEIPDFTSLYYNSSLEGCTPDEIENAIRELFLEECFLCKQAFDECCY